MGGGGGGESRKLRICPAPFKNSLLPFKRAEPALPIKVGGEVAPFPLKHPFRFHARRFPNVSALRSLPPPHPSGLSPAVRTRGTSGDPETSRGGRREGGAPAAAVQEWGPGRGAGARALPTAPGARHPTFISGHSRTQTPTSPLVRHDATCTEASSSPLPLASGLGGASRASRARGILGVVVPLRPRPTGLGQWSWGSAPGRGKQGLDAGSDAPLYQYFLFCFIFYFFCFSLYQY